MEGFSKTFADNSKKMQDIYIKKGDSLSESERKKTKDYIAEVMKRELIISNLIKKERAHQNSISNSSNTQQLQNQLNQLSQQIQTLLNSQNKNPADNSNNNQLQKIQEQLNSLQNQIQNLENKPNNSSVSQSDKQELSKLKNQIQQLQKDLQSKQADNQKSTSNSQQNEGFNWLYVVIPGGVLLVVIGIVIAYLVGKKNKRE
jgi:neutral trehalase